MLKRRLGTSDQTTNQFQNYLENRNRTVGGFWFSLYLSQILTDGIKAFVLRLGVGEDVACLPELVLQLQDSLLIVGFLTGRLLDQRLFSALSICRHLPVVGVGLSKGLEIQWKRRELLVWNYSVMGLLRIFRDLCMKHHLTFSSIRFVTDTSLFVIQPLQSDNDLFYCGLAEAQKPPQKYCSCSVEIISQAPSGLRDPVFPPFPPPLSSVSCRILACMYSAVTPQMEKPNRKSRANALVSG